MDVYIREGVRSNNAVATISISAREGPGIQGHLEQ